jgi:hypothetical protein
VLFEILQKPVQSSFGFADEWSRRPYAICKSMYLRGGDVPNRRDTVRRGGAKVKNPCGCRHQCCFHVCLRACVCVQQLLSKKAGLQANGGAVPETVVLSCLVYSAKACSIESRPCKLSRSRLVMHERTTSVALSRRMVATRPTSEVHKTLRPKRHCWCRQHMATYVRVRMCMVINTHGEQKDIRSAVVSLRCDTTAHGCVAKNTAKQHKPCIRSGALLAAQMQ